MPSIHRLGRGLPRRSPHRRRNPRGGSKPPLDVEISVALVTAAVLALAVVIKGGATKHADGRGFGGLLLAVDQLDGTCLKAGDRTSWLSTHQSTPKDTRPHVRLRTGRPVSQYAGNEGCAGLA